MSTLYYLLTLYLRGVRIPLLLPRVITTATWAGRLPTWMRRPSWPAWKFRQTKKKRGVLYSSSCHSEVLEISTIKNPMSKFKTLHIYIYMCGSYIVICTYVCLYVVVCVWCVCMCVCIHLFIICMSIYVVRNVCIHILCIYACICASIYASISAPIYAFVCICIYLCSSKIH